MGWYPRPTGRRVEVPILAIFEFDEDRLLCEKAYMDMATVLTQMGCFLLPAKQGRAKRLNRCGNSQRYWNGREWSDPPPRPAKGPLA